jgi:hypothetical protein
MLQREILIGKRSRSIDRCGPSAVTIEKIASLDHEILNLDAFVELSRIHAKGTNGERGMSTYDDVRLDGTCIPCTPEDDPESSLSLQYRIGENFQQFEASHLQRVAF